MRDRSNQGLRCTAGAAPHNAGRRRSLAALGSMAAASFWMKFAHGQAAYPQHAVRIVNPYPPGSPVDLVGRYAADVMQRHWKQACNVESVTGAGGTIGVGVVVRAEPDGYNLLTQQSTALVCGQFLYKTAAYDVTRDLRGIWALRSSGLVLVVHPNSKYRSLQDLVTAAKASPGKLNFASTGIGSPQHFGGALLMRETGTRLTHIPYRGAAPTQMALMSGEVDCLFDSIAGALPYIEAGKMRPLAVNRSTRFYGLPDVPTAGEAGVDGLQLPIASIGIYAPGATPIVVTDQIAALLDESFGADTDARSRFKTLGMTETVARGPLNQQIAQEQAFFRKLIKDANITMDN